jgi:hypothetical protein
LTVSRITASVDSQPVIGSPDWATVRQLYLLVPGAFSKPASSARVTRNARCADASLDADQWFPVSVEADRARQEAAAAIAICSTCMVRTQCLALSLRDWDTGLHGVWGGLAAAERAALRRGR